MYNLASVIKLKKEKKVENGSYKKIWIKLPSHSAKADNQKGHFYCLRYALSVYAGRHLIAFTFERPSSKP